MSGARCCCDRGTWTKLTRCTCGDGATEPAYVDWYTPDMGCGYFKTGAGGGVCWFIGPESPTKASLDVGDVDAGGNAGQFVEVDDPNIACCACCGCGVSELTPDACFDTPVGGCTCCPDFGVNDGNEWIWSYQDSTVYEGVAFSGALRPGVVADAYGTIHAKNSPGGICARILSVDAHHSMSKWSLGTSGYPLICSVSVDITDCADLLDRFDGLNGRWVPPCGKRINPRPEAGSGLNFWPIPTDASLTGDCDERAFAGGESGGISSGVDWDATAFDGTSGCNWTGRIITDSATTLTKTEGTITFSGSCHFSRVEWSYVWTRFSKSQGKLTNRLTTSGFLEYALAKAPCPGGCGQRARFFGVGAIPPAGGGPAMMVPQSLGGLLL